MHSTKRLWKPEARAKKHLKLGSNTILAIMQPGCLILTATILRSSIKASRRQNIVHQGGATSSAVFASSERSMRWTNSWGRGLNRSAGRAPGHCVLRWGQDVPSFPHAPFLAPALFLRCASDSFSLTKLNTSCTIELPASLHSDGVRDHPGTPFGFLSE